MSVTPAIRREQAAPTDPAATLAELTDERLVYASPATSERHRRMLAAARELIEARGFADFTVRNGAGGAQAQLADLVGDGRDLRRAAVSPPRPLCGVTTGAAGDRAGCSPPAEAVPAVASGPRRG